MSEQSPIQSTLISIISTVEPCNHMTIRNQESIANLYRYKKVSSVSNLRYLNTLGDTIDKSILIKKIEKVSSKVIVKGRKYIGFNMLDKETTELFKILFYDGYR